MKKKEQLTLKWGSLKGWDLNKEGPTFKLLQKYGELGMSTSAMLQKDTPEQKELLCQMIDTLDGEIWNDWDGVLMEKEAAKRYVREYGMKS